MFFRTVKASFAMRRKTLLNGLSSGFGSQLSKEQIAGAIAAQRSARPLSAARHWASLNLPPWPGS